MRRVAFVRKLLGLGLGLGLGLVACEDSAPAIVTDGIVVRDLARATDLMSVDQSAPPIEFEDFVLGLINTQTADTTLPTKTEDKNFIDSMDPTKFAPLFP